MAELPDLGRTLIAAQSHRRTSEPPTIATRRTRTAPYHPAPAVLPWRRVGEVAVMVLVLVALAGLWVVTP